VGDAKCSTCVLATPGNSAQPAVLQTFVSVEKPGEGRV
jgi:hypothetical protein